MDLKIFHIATLFHPYYIKSITPPKRHTYNKNILLGSSALVRQLVKEKENSELKPVKLRLKN